MSELPYEAIVLAAGKNARLKGVMPAYHKPLITVDGKPLVVNIVTDLLDMGFGHVAIVVSPENCAPITEVLADNDLLKNPTRVTLVVQPVARGPGEGLLRALRTCRSPRVLLALADNVIPYGDYLKVMRIDNEYITINKFPSEVQVTVGAFETRDEEQAGKFTRVAMDLERKRKVFVEDVSCDPDQDGLYTCWVGPMAFDRKTAETLFSEAALVMDPAQELKISRLFNRIDKLHASAVMCRSKDIGTKDALLQLREAS